MTFERIPSPNHPLYADAMALYGISFPAHEQRETPSQTAILTHPDYHFTAILDGSAFVGDMLYWETPDFRYIEHFCILPALRGQRYGSRALSMLPNDRPVILEIDPPVDEIAIRRRRGLGVSDALAANVATRGRLAGIGGSASTRLFRFRPIDSRPCNAA